MRFSQESGRHIIDGSGNFVLSKNDNSIYIEGSLPCSVRNWKVRRVGDNFKEKLRTSVAVFKYIWKDTQC